MAHSAQNGLHQFMLVFLTSVRRIETGRLKGLEPAWTFLGENYRKSYGVLKRVRFFIVRALARPKPGEPDQIHLSWNEDPSVSFTVTWHTPSRDASAAVNHRPREGGPWQTIVADDRGGDDAFARTRLYEPPHDSRSFSRFRLRILGLSGLCLAGR